MSLQNVNSYTYTPGFTQGQYHNAVLCISGNVQSLYLNGVLVGSTTTASNILSYYPTINQILLGCAGDKSNGFTGYLDDFRIYKYAFNQSQVSSLYSNRNLIAYYPFDTSFNNVANNIITTGNNATLAYDATLVGNATISTTTDNYFVGTGALNLTNTAGTTSTAYVNSTCKFSTYITNQLSISLWFKTTGVAGRKMRLFDLCPALGTQGIYVDISGTNGINTISNAYTLPIPTNYIKSLSPTEYFPLLSDYTNYGSSSITISASTSANISFTTLGSKTCVTFTSNAYLRSSSLGASLPLPVSFCFWCYIPSSPFPIGDSGWETFTIGDGNFSNNAVLQSDVYDNTRFNTFLALPSLWTAIPQVNVNNQQWSHICYTISSSSVIFYLNGTNVGSTAGTYSWKSINPYYYILGRAADLSPRYLNGGGIRHFASFNKVLSATEVTNIYNNST